MSVAADLRDIIPDIVALVENNNHEIGERSLWQDEDGYGMGDEYRWNQVCYDKDGWRIEVTYKCCGEWNGCQTNFWSPPWCGPARAWGEVTEIIACHFDDGSGEETDFGDEDLVELRKALNEVLSDIPV